MVTQNNFEKKAIGISIKKKNTTFCDEMVIF